MTSVELKIIISNQIKTVGFLAVQNSSLGDLAMFSLTKPPYIQTTDVSMERYKPFTKKWHVCQHISFILKVQT